MLNQCKTCHKKQFTPSELLDFLQVNMCRDCFTKLNAGSPVNDYDTGVDDIDLSDK